MAVSGISSQLKDIQKYVQASQIKAITPKNAPPSPAAPAADADGDGDVNASPAAKPPGLTGNVLDVRA